MGGKIVGVLEDEAEVRDAIAMVLARGGHRPVPYASAAELRAALAAGRAPAVLLCDLDLGAETAIELAPEVLAASPSTLLVALTGHVGDTWVFPALAAGFVGYVLKSDAFDRLVEVVDEVVAGGSPLSRDVARRVLRSFGTEERARPSVETSARETSARETTEETTLSPREHDVLRLLADGYRYDQIAGHLGISLGSVRTYVQRLYGKLGVSTKSEATARALRGGWLR